MRRTSLPLFGIALALSACGSGNDGYVAESEAAYDDVAAPQAEFGFMEASEPGIVERLTAPTREVTERVTTVDIAEPPPAPGAETGPATGEIPVSLPQIAYSYAFGFRVDTDRMAPLQQRHADLCESKGSDACRIISMQQSGSSGDYAYGHLRLAVAADLARDFGKELAGAADDAGGEQISSSITGEDLSKRIVDTEARLRARTLLRDRLMEVLRSRKGTVAELVEAERGVAQVNEEIDQASSWLAEMRGRVAFSDVEITYQSEARTAGGFWNPIRTALNSIGGTLGVTIATLIVVLTAILPWLLLLALAIWGWRKAGLRLWRRKQRPYSAHPVETEEETQES